MRIDPTRNGVAGVVALSLLGALHCAGPTPPPAVPVEPIDSATELPSVAAIAETRNATSLALSNSGREAASTSVNRKRRACGPVASNAAHTRPLIPAPTTTI